jgi:hypothetical protein
MAKINEIEIKRHISERLKAKSETSRLKQSAETRLERKISSEKLSSNYIDNNYEYMNQLESADSFESSFYDSPRKEAKGFQRKSFELIEEDEF